MPRALQLLYAWASQFLSRGALFNAIIAVFVSFFVVFAAFLYPNADVLHPHALADALELALPSGLAGGWVGVPAAAWGLGGGVRSRAWG